MSFIGIFSKKNFDKSGTFVECGVQYLNFSPRYGINAAYNCAREIIGLDSLEGFGISDYAIYGCLSVHGDCSIIDSWNADLAALLGFHTDYSLLPHAQKTL